METTRTMIAGAAPVPTVAHSVVYHTDGAPRSEYAAVITEVDEPGNPESAVGLCVLHPDGTVFYRHCMFGADPGCWQWPEPVARAVTPAMARHSSADDPQDEESLPLRAVSGMVGEMVGIKYDA